MKLGRGARVKRRQGERDGRDLHAAWREGRRGREYERDCDRRKLGEQEERSRRWRILAVELDWGCEAGDRGEVW